MKQPFDLSRLRAAFKTGFTDEARRAATPHLVHCHDLNEERLGQQPFCREFQDRRLWIEAYCNGLHEVEPILDEVRRVTGRRYRFADADDAFAFKLRFG